LTIDGFTGGASPPAFAAAGRASAMLAASASGMVVLFLRTMWVGLLSESLDEE
jgi:hypothetical protein